jgi:hypothetical protein
MKCSLKNKTPNDRPHKAKKGMIRSVYRPGISLKKIWLCLIGVALFLSSQARNETRDTCLFTDDLFLSEVNPLHGFGIFTFNTPFYIGAFNNKEQKFSVGYSSGNTWHPLSTIYYPLNMNARQTQEANALYMTDRPAYFESEGISMQRKTFSTDGVLQTLNFTYLIQLAEKGTFIFKLNTFLLSGGSSPLHYLVSDKFIENIHTQVGLDDNFGRKLFPFDQAHLFYQDENGREISIDKGQAFLGTFDINYYKPIWQAERRTSYFSAQGGAHLSLPLNKYYPKVAGGISVSLLFRKIIFPRFYSDLAADCSFNHYSLASLGKAPNLIDRDIRLSAKSYISLNLISKRDRTFCFGLICNYQDSYLKGNIYNLTQDNYRDLGVSYLKAGDNWDGTTVTKTPRLSKLTAASMYYFSLKPYFFCGFKGKKTDLIFNVCEDYPLVNNAPDVQFGFQLTRKLGKVFK